ncbi:predicted protein [Chaetomium globosum CBS 148.51]|uniref:Uncharacterized protein n=1 Tax=Chaetomium globosum (strain ATCC 6205 / CBS 148.51 / DSM 1962 / NBRC 6347 / NRRL 1970) TaxID=306901 RepID=Q2HF27_CHAGB|nr:uncharacterized protein CHGG_01177 [Chaetomium globosum CBS 148.51]EAQ92942.1 predicted protein [Chaetomium globosum CBS 148.51]
MSAWLACCCSWWMLGSWMLAGKLQENASCRRLRAEEAGDGDLLLGQTGLSTSGHITEFLCSVPSHVPAQNAGLQASSATCGPGGPGQPRPHLGGAGLRTAVFSDQWQSPATHRICVPCQTGEMDVASNVGATPGPGACCPTTPPTFLGMIARIFWVQATVAVVFGNLLSALASPTAELLSDGIPSAEIELLPACRISGNHQQRVPSIDGRLRPNNRAKLGLDRPASERRGPHRGRPLSSVTVRGAPRKTPTDGDLRLIFSSGRRFARIASPDGRCRREPSRELPLSFCSYMYASHSALRTRRTRHLV